MGQMKTFISKENYSERTAMLWIEIHISILPPNVHNLDERVKSQRKRLACHVGASSRPSCPTPDRGSLLICQGNQHKMAECGGLGTHMGDQEAAPHSCFARQVLVLVSIWGVN